MHKVIAYNPWTEEVYVSFETSDSDFLDKIVELIFECFADAWVEWEPMIWENQRVQ